MSSVICHCSYVGSGKSAAFRAALQKPLNLIEDESEKEYLLKVHIFLFDQ